MSVVLLALLACPSAGSGAQEPVDADARRAERLRVFLDCSAPGCDFDFFRTEITYVDWVRDREDAGVHILVTSEPTGAGGRLYHLDFDGGNAFEELDFQHDFATREWYTVEEQRSALSRRLQAGLLPYLSSSEEFDWIEIRRTDPESVYVQNADPQPAEDPWKGWVVNLGVDGSYGGETRTRSRSYAGSISLDRTTETSRVSLTSRWSKNKDEFDFEDQTFVSTVESHGTKLSMIRRLDDHWGVGGRPELWSSTFENTELGVRFPVAVEANLFPYSQFTRRAILFHYSIGWNALRYFEETLFDKTREQVFDHRAGVSLQFIQGWGTADVELGGSQYLHDPDRYRLLASGTLSIRLLRGLSMDLFGSYESIHDQLSIPKGGASEEEVLLRLKALETSFYAYASIGFSYRFGSIFNNAVNPTLSWFR
ncbi:MAG: hypothetical protein AMS19_11930 [Gemmatimonas sp. SG8_23]|nr:MAG: hypothetical protein AMS19_11930 [Gemmatimonas sp. SG8_23]